MPIVTRRNLLKSCAGSALAAWMSACSFGQAGMAPYGVAMNGDGNSLAITPMPDVDGGYRATILSPRGIGQAVVTWWGNALPHQLTFALALTGLEHFGLQWADQTVNLSVNSIDQVVYATMSGADGSEVAITPASPYWMEVTSSNGDIQGFEVSAPHAFLATWPPVWSVSWVDSYR